MQDVNDSVSAANGRTDKNAEAAKNGADGRLRNFEDVLMYLDAICPRQLIPEFNLKGMETEATALGLRNLVDTPALENKVQEQEQEEEEDDPLRPHKAPDQSKPKLLRMSQESHDLKLADGMYMQTDGLYAYPINPFKDEEEANTQNEDN